MRTAITTAMITATLVIMGALAMAQTASQKHAADLVRVFLVERGLDANVHAGEVVDYGGGNVVDSRGELNPAAVIGGKTSGWDYAMDVRVMS